MANDIPRQSFQVKDLPTKSVTLYPSRAHVVREICDIVLKPGQNEIQIHGLSPSVDENSVQIDGQGDASITDLTLELVPNTEDIRDTYPVESDTSDTESDDDGNDEEIPKVKAITGQIEALELKINEALERQLSAEHRLNTLDEYTKTLKGDNITHEEVAKFLSMYERERLNLFKINVKANEDLKAWRNDKAKKETMRTKAGKEEEKRKTKLAKEKAKQKQKKMHVKMERAQELARLDIERRKFWPANIYMINLRLESSINTPGSSRRNSIGELTLSEADVKTLKKDGTESIISSERTVSLSLSYVTNSAFWSPRYDLSISSLNKTASIVYRAEFNNGTSETWKDAKVILSTSQTSYSGLNDKAPTLDPWHVKLAKYEQNGGLLSSAETNGPRHRQAMALTTAKKNAVAQSYGIAPFAPVGLVHNSGPQTAAIGGNHALQDYQMQMMLLEQQNKKRLLMARQGQEQVQTSQMQQQPLMEMAPVEEPMQPYSSKKKKSKKGVKSKFETTSNDGLENFDFDSFLHDNLAADSNVLDFEESVWEDSGLTASYELPGTRTLVPSSLARRHKIASLHATNIHLSYIAVPILRAAAFLNAKVRNPSNSVTLLKGIAGVTLDGSFLGNIPLPRVSPNQTFTLPLGVDPAIHISYPKPTVHRSTQGFLSKESVHTFNRSVWLTNTKSSSIELVVLDHVPVSQDDKLKMEILQPKGLYKDGDSVKAGEAAKEGTAASGSAWGTATAILKKDGEINWNVVLEKGQAALLKLEYEARLPSGDNIVTV